MDLSVLSEYQAIMDILKKYIPEKSPYPYAHSGSLENRLLHTELGLNFLYDISNVPLILKHTECYLLGTFCSSLNPITQSQNWDMSRGGVQLPLTMALFVYYLSTIPDQDFITLSSTRLILCINFIYNSKFQVISLWHR